MCTGGGWGRGACAQVAGGGRACAHVCKDDGHVDVARVVWRQVRSICQTTRQVSEPVRCLLEPTWGLRGAPFVAKRGRGHAVQGGEGGGIDRTCMHTRWKRSSRRRAQRGLHAGEGAGGGHLWLSMVTRRRSKFVRR